MTKKYNGKHLSNTQRIYIEKGLVDGLNFTAIAEIINKHPTTVSKEIKKHRYYPDRKDQRKPIVCSRRKICQIRFLCEKKDCFKLCKLCYGPACNGDCRSLCPEYQPKVCTHLLKPPYVCNGCSKIRQCKLQQSFYAAKEANEVYYDNLISSRIGINQSPVDIAMLDQLISPLLLKNQSMAHIYAHHGHEIPCSRRTLYNYIDKGIFEARNIDLRRRVKYKCKPRRTPTRVSLAAREFRTGRTYEDFTNFMKDNPNANIIEMDTVEGLKGKDSKVLLTIFFRSCSLMLIFILDRKTQENVIDVFDIISEKLGIETFLATFPVILTDNGVEFQNPKRLEFDKNGNKRTTIYYCNPNSSWQKGAIEKNHHYIRYVIPKGKSMDIYDQKDIHLLMNHINSEARDSLNGCSPYQLSQFLLNNDVHKLLKLKKIEPDNVRLMPSLLKK